MFIGKKRPFPLKTCFASATRLFIYFVSLCSSIIATSLIAEFVYLLYPFIVDRCVIAFVFFINNHGF